MKHLTTILILGGYIVVTLSDTEMIVKIVAGLITIGYYSRRWWIMEKTKQKSE